MEYFRRPSIAGNNATFISYAKVRGSVRRNDADGTSAVPYFSNLVAGQDISITVCNDGVVTTSSISLPSKSLSTVISTINSVPEFSGKLLAVEEDGALSLQCLTPGGESYVSVTGGSGSAAVGFDVRPGEIISYGGDLTTSPHGRLGNRHGTSVLNKGENLTAESVQRGLDRLAANADVLFSDLMRQNAVLQKVDSFVVSVDGAYLTPSPHTRIFTGGLSNTSSKEDLASYFFLFDRVTKQPSSARVSAVTRGLPIGSIPYTDCPDWSGVGNVLGVDLVKQGGISITSILEGRTLELGTAVISDVVVGDLVSIEGATNITPSTNNGGVRWVIESIDSTRTLLTVRPLSKSELEEVGGSFLPAHARVELNGHREMLETYGTANIHTGYATSNVILHLDPPLPNNAQVDLWAAQPLSIREEAPQDRSIEGYPSSIGPQSDLDTSVNAILSRPSISPINTPSAGKFQVGGYYVRWHGRVCYVPAITLTPANPSEGYAYWDEPSCSTKLIEVAQTTSLNGPEDSSPITSASAAVGSRGKPIAYYFKSAGSIGKLQRIVRVEGNSSPTITVGWGGDFLTLNEALDHLSYLAFANAEVNDFAEAPSAHADIVLLSDCELLTSAKVFLPSIKIRGANGKIRLSIYGNYGIVPDSGMPLPSSGVRLTIEDLTLRVVNSGTKLTSDCLLTLNRVEQDPTAVAFQALCSDIGQLTVKDSHLLLSGGINFGCLNSPKVYLENSTFDFTTGTDMQLFTASNTGPSASTTYLSECIAKNCRFIGITQTYYVYPIFIHSSGTESYVFEDCIFTFASLPNNTGLIYLGNNTLKMSRCTVGEYGVLACPSFIIGSSSTGGTPFATVDTCTVYASPKAGNPAAVWATSVRGCHIVGNAYGTGPNDTALEVRESASENIVEGSFTHGVRAASYSRVSDNRVALVPPAINGTCVEVVGDGVSLVGNKISTSGSYIGFCIRAPSSLSRVVLRDNTVQSSGSSTMVSLESPSYYVISGNSFLNTTGGGSTAVSINSPSNTIFDGNTVNLYTVADHGNEYAGTALSATGSGSISVSNNTIYASTTFNISATVVPLISGNSVNSLGSIVLSGSFLGNRCSGQWTFKDNINVSGNTFNTADETDDYLPEGGVVLQPTASGCFLSFTDNIVNSVTTGTAYGISCLSSAATSSIDITANRSAGPVSVEAAKSFIFNSNIVDSSVSISSVAAGNLEVVGNSVISTLSVTPVNSTAIVIESNTVNGLSSSLPPSGLRGGIVGNRVSSGGISITAPSSCDAKISITGNTSAGTVSLTSDPTSSARFEFSSNRFLSTTIDAAAGSVVFSGNTVEGATTLIKSDVSGNHFTQIAVNAPNCREFSNNVCEGSVTVSARSNEVCSFSGNTVTSTSSSVSLTWCYGAGNDIQSSSISLTSCNLSSSYFTSSSSITFSSCSIDSSTVVVSSGGISATGSLFKSSGSYFLGSGATLPFVISSDICSIDDSIISGIFGLLLASISSSEIRVSSSFFLGALTTTGSDLRITDSKFASLLSTLGSSVELCQSSSSSNVSISGASHINVSGCNIGGDLMVQPPSGSDVVLVSSSRISGSIRGVSSIGAVSAFIVNSSSFSSMTTASGFTSRLTDCLLGSFTANGTPADKVSNFVLEGCSLYSSPDGSGQVYSDATNGITASILNCTLNSIVLDGRVHDIHIKNNNIDGGKVGSCPPIYILDGDENSRVHISGNTITTHGASSGGSRFGCINLGIVDLPSWPSPSGVQIPNVSIESNIMKDTGLSDIDIVKVTARVLGGVVSNNRILANASSTGNYVKLECGGDNLRGVQCNNMVFSGNMFAKLNLDGKTISTTSGTQVYIDNQSGYRFPGQGDSMMLGDDKAHMGSLSGDLAYKVLIPI